MLERPGNRRFARNLFDTGDRVLLDHSTSTVPPLSAALLAVRSSPVVGFALAATVLSLVGAWGAGLVGRFSALASARLPWTGRRRTGPRTGVDVDADALVAHVRRRHPDWDPDRVRRVAQGVLPDPDERREDE
jgi:hypothetical protein